MVSGAVVEGGDEGRQRYKTSEIQNVIDTDVIDTDVIDTTL